jgi:hypothetical protein
VSPWLCERNLDEEITLARRLVICENQRPEVNREFTGRIDINDGEH